MNYLIGKGIAPSRLTAKGFGKKQPIVSNRTEKGRALNRRVEFIVTKK
jgi:OOP family OmpA-OmpF porin